MENPHRFFLSLGSNIEPEHHLAEAIRRLREFGDVQELSSVWESRAVGSAGPNFLNACLSFVAPVEEPALKRDIVEAIEIALGRARTDDKNAPRPIDIDILMDDDRVLNADRWDHPFVLLPMAELLPEARHPSSGRTLAEEARKAASQTWIRRRQGVLADEDGREA